MTAYANMWVIHKAGPPAKTCYKYLNCNVFIRIVPIFLRHR